ncbi:MAG: DUF1573 domain-containing protein [Bacteroidales bacterium]|nr:DUF1573 domain-containing protein [Bacteroidales bacterium]
MITKTSSSCGCTVPHYNSSPVMSDRTGRITVRYNTTRLGGFHKTIVVRSNAANQSTAILFIKGFVKKRKGARHKW